MSVSFFVYSEIPTLGFPIFVVGKDPNSLCVPVAHMAKLFPNRRELAFDSAFEQDDVYSFILGNMDRLNIFYPNSTDETYMINQFIDIEDFCEIILDNLWIFPEGTPNLAKWCEGIRECVATYIQNIETVHEYAVKRKADDDIEQMFVVAVKKQVQDMYTQSQTYIDFVRETAEHYERMCTNIMERESEEAKKNLLAKKVEYQFQILEKEVVVRKLEATIKSFEC